jgi:hypothetical protein
LNVDHLATGRLDSGLCALDFLRRPLIANAGVQDEDRFVVTQLLTSQHAIFRPALHAPTGFS